MATIGLDKLYYSKITEDSNGEETYSTPLVLAKAITAELSVELVEAILYADDGAAEVVKDFNSGNRLPAVRRFQLQYHSAFYDYNGCRTGRPVADCGSKNRYGCLDQQCG